MRITCMLSLLVLVICGLSAVTVAGGARPITRVGVPPFTLVDGTQRATIVVPRSGPEVIHDEQSHLELASDALLVDTVKQMTGVTLAVVKEGEPTTGPVIYLGRTAHAQTVLGRQLATLDRDGYILLARPGELLIAGGSEYGAYFGVSTLLQQYAGVRWLFPGP
ncbi:MAG TPA: glycoside hydrolase family 20 zincin-like fold domain-containing protein, partial [Armatimonadota bacterium]